jgi:enamine deaminase RidA (YjgF/YER057c/UK114 family)
MSREPVHIDKPWVKESAFAQGVTVEGKLLYSSGITARAPDGSVVGVGDIRKQIEICFENLGDVLRAAGAGFGDVVKYTMYTTDIDAFREHTDVYRAHFIDHPASTLVEVSKLAHPDMTVEIEAVARVP